MTTQPTAITTTSTAADAAELTPGAIQRVPTGVNRARRRRLVLYCPGCLLR